MTVPTDKKLHEVAGLVDKVGNFGAWPPTEAYRDAFKAHGVLLNLMDESITSDAHFAEQIAGIRSHRMWAGVWHPVPPGGDDGAARAKWIHEKITRINFELLKLPKEPFIQIIWLNFEGYTISQWREFLWGRVSGNVGQMLVKGWRGTGGAIGSTGGYRNGLPTGVVDEPFKDGTVKPMVDLMRARVMLAVEGFYGPTSEWPDMTPADHPRAIIDRLHGFRSDGTLHLDEAWPFDQVVGCYDAALGAVVKDEAKGVAAEPLLIRAGLHFTLERARQQKLI